MKIAICSHPEKSKGRDYKGTITAWLKKRGHVVVDEDSSDIDLVIVLGGDGFTMHMAGKFSLRKIPVIALNIGDVGFLTSRNISESDYLLNRIVNGAYNVEERMSLKLMFNGQNFGPYVNDVYLKHSKSMAIFKIAVNDDVIHHELRADGFIVSTPTGSTAYVMSSGGPILWPDMSAFVLMPISPYNCNTRPIIVNGNTKIKVGLKSTRGSGSVSVIADGIELGNIFENEEITITKDPTKLLFATLDKKDYLTALREKKGLMG